MQYSSMSQIILMILLQMSSLTGYSKSGPSKEVMETHNSRVNSDSRLRVALGNSIRAVLTRIKWKRLWRPWRNHHACNIDVLWDHYPHVPSR